MENYPQSLIELEKMFDSDESCKEYLFKIRWPLNFVCPYCNNNKAWHMSNGLYRCTSCKKRTSITAGTIFDRSKISLVLWFRAIWWIMSQKNGASAKGLQRILSIGSYETVWMMLHKMRRSMVRQGRDRLAGTIQVDESYIGGKKSGKRGRGASGKSLVFIAAQLDGKYIGRIRLKRIADASATNLENAIQEFIVPGSIIQTDAWSGYNNIDSIGYKREIIKKSEETGKNLLPKCHRISALLKRWLIGTLQGAVSHEHLEYYLDEYTFRFNRRTSPHRGKLFLRFLEQAMVTDPVVYENIIQNVKKNRDKHNIMM